MPGILHIHVEEYLMFGKGDSRKRVLYKWQTDHMMVSLCTITAVQDSGHRWLEQEQSYLLSPMQTCTHTVGLLHGALLSVLLRVCIAPCWQHGGPASDRTGLSICRIYPGFTRVSHWGSQWVSKHHGRGCLAGWLLFTLATVSGVSLGLCKQSVINLQTLANPYYFDIILWCPGFTPMCVIDVFKMFLNRFILASPCDNVMLSQDDLYGSLSYCLIASIFSLE